MTSGEQTLALHQLDSLDSPLHQQLLAALDDLSQGLAKLVRDAEGKEDQEMLRTQVWEAVDSHNYVMSGLQMFRASLETEAVNLEQKLEVLNQKKEGLLDERDELIEKGHELNCRIGYNALERKLEETFTDTEKYTTLESARCFRDEAEEEHRRTNDLIRIGNMRACQIDRDLYNEMEKITDLFENYERDREHYVRELDLFCDVRRQRISAWLAAEGRTESEREAAEEMLDYLSLTEKHRHMEAQLIKSELRMYSFNASLAFDREDNQKLLEELTSVQCEVNCVSGQSLVVPRAATARTDLTTEVQEVSRCGEGEGRGEDSPGHAHELSGRGLHRCPRKSHLATDPITDVALAARLEAALRWEEKDGEDNSLGEAAGSSFSDVMENPRRCDVSQEEVKAAGGGQIGDHQQNVNSEDKLDSETVMVTKERQLIECAELGTDSTHTLESYDMMPGPADRHAASVVRKKKSSLTSFSSTFSHAEGPPSGHRLTVADSQERLTRSQGSEPALRAPGGGAKSRDVTAPDVTAARPATRQREPAAEHRTRSSGCITRGNQEDLLEDC